MTNHYPAFIILRVCQEECALLDIKDVLLTENKKSSYKAVLERTSLSYRTGDFPVEGHPVIEVTVENKGDRKFRLSGCAAPVIRIPCARCLKPVLCRLDVRFDFETDPDETTYIDGYYLDVDQLIHDEALLVWPERVLCREDCKGLCSICGHDLNDGPCGCEHTQADPRMAKILDIFHNFKEV